MSVIFRRHLLFLAGAWLAASAGAAWAQGPAAAGRFLSVAGDVRVTGTDGKRRTAERGGDFREGETILTGPNALAQLRTGDGGLLSVRSDTEMKLDKFAFAGENDKNASFLVSLVKGGFRTITGLIGRANRDGYKVTTPSATIGIRGTHYELVHVLPQAASQQAQAGTYNRVYDGITTLQNKAGVLVLVNRDQTAFVSLPGNVAPVLVTPPAQIFGKPTPVPRLTPQSSSGGTQTPSGGDEKAQATGAAPASGATRSQPATLVKPDSSTTIRSGTTSTLQVAPTTTLTPIDSTTTIKSPTTSTLQLAPTTTISPTTTLQTAPTTTISPTTTLQTAPTTTISPTTTLQTAPIMSTTPITTTAPLTSPTTTIQPSTSTTLSPTTTTIKLAPTTTITK